MKKSVVAIITARGGSKGLPRKNVLDLAGKPLIAHTIQAALESKIFDKVVVTTDDTEIKEVSLQYGAEVIDRPEYLATDSASSVDVIAHALETLKENGKNKYTHFILLQPTSPLRNSVHIKEAWDQYISAVAESLVSVTETEHSPYKMLLESPDGMIPMVGWEYFTMPRQQLPKTFQINGAIYINKLNAKDWEKDLFKKPISFFTMRKDESIDIDTEFDLTLAESIMEIIKCHL